MRAMIDASRLGYRGRIGWIHSLRVMHDQTILETHKLLPPGFGMIIGTLGKEDGSASETEKALANVNSCAKQLKEYGAEHFVLNSVPMVTHGGPGADTSIIDSIREETGLRATTTITAALAALRALGVKRIAVLRTHEADRAEAFIEASGFEIAGSSQLPPDLRSVERIPPELGFRAAKDAFLAADGAEALYVAGGRTRILDVIDELEHDLRVPVVNNLTSTVWDVLSHMGGPFPIDGYGVLLRDWPDHVG